jgi:predicted nucleic acid-binding protein
MSNACFVDTFALLAMLNPADRRHQDAMRWMSASRRPLVITEWILTELGDALCAARTRAAFLAVERRLRADPRVQVVTSAPDLFQGGLALYAGRPDKDWSLTDCISFETMRTHGIRDALTADHHFEQAGFTALLK